MLFLFRLLGVCVCVGGVDKMTAAALTHLPTDPVLKR